MSFETEGKGLRFRCYFDKGADDNDKAVVKSAIEELRSWMDDSIDIVQEHLDGSEHQLMDHPGYTLYERYEPRMTGHAQQDEGQISSESALSDELSS